MNFIGLCLILVIIIACVLYTWPLIHSKIVEANGFKYRVRATQQEKAKELLTRLNDLAINVIKSFRHELEKMRRMKNSSTYRLIKEIYEQLNKRYNPDGLNESIILPLNRFTTSYTTRKGKHICVCLRNKDGFHEWPVIAMVFLHELAHVASISWSLDAHNAEFWRKYAMILAIADKYNLVKPKKIPMHAVNYCDRLVIPAEEFKLISK